MKSKYLYFLLVLFVVTFVVWNDQRFTLPTDKLASIALEAEKTCADRGLPLPPKSFTTDGCSMWLNGVSKTDWVDCCIRHDYDYWCGGSTQDRDQADKDLGKCVRERVSALGTPTYWGVRFGGVSWLPTPWRWGYGWPYFTKQNLN